MSKVNRARLCGPQSNQGTRPLVLLIFESVLIRVKEKVEIDWDSETTDPKSMKKIEQEFMRVLSQRKPNGLIAEEDLIDRGVEFLTFYITL